MAIRISRQRWNAARRRTTEQADTVAEHLRRQGHDVHVINNDQMHTLAHVEYDTLDEGAAVAAYLAVDNGRNAMDAQDQALQELISRIAHGEEFADVSYDVALKYRVAYSGLLHAFDQVERQEVTQ